MKELTKRNYVSPIVTMTSIQLEEGICGNTNELINPDKNDGNVGIDGQIDGGNYNENGNEGWD